MAINDKKILINNQIRTSEIRLIGDNVEEGIYKLNDALNKADELGLDLVEVNNINNVSICKIIDFEKYLYEIKKKQKEIGKKQKENKLKEMQFSINIDEHDYQFKKNNLQVFLEKGNTIKSVVSFKGREITFLQKGRDIIKRLLEDLSDFGVCDNPNPSLEGKKYIITIKPKKKK